MLPPSIDATVGVESMRSPISSLRRLLLVVATLLPLSLHAQYADGLVAYWPFDGDLLDESTSAAHGTLIEGSGDAELRFAPAQFNDGVDLNNFAAGAFEQYVEITGGSEDLFDFAGGSMTVSLWCSTPFLSIDNQTIIAKGNGDSWRLSRDGGNSAPAFSGGLNTAATGDPLLHFLDDTSMHHVVGVVEAGVGVRLYLDGQLISNVNGDAQLGDSPARLAIGGNPEAAADLFRTWEGIIDDVAIWSRALNGGEIATLYNNGTGVSVGEALNPVDTDSDGMPDFYENTNGLDPNVDDAGDDLDSDGLTNLEEFQGGTDPQSGDTDDDGLSDGDEINVHSTSPVNGDTDGDGLGDGDEVNGTLNPFLDNTLRPDFDPENDPAGDPTDPSSTDSDGDEFDDKTEIDFKSDPNDIEESPSSWQIGLKGYWPLDKASYDASDDDSFPDASGRGFPGQLAGDSLTPNWFGNPFYPQVVRLDGSSQRIEIQGEPDEFAMAGEDITISAWFLTPAWGKTWQAVVAKGEGSNWRVHRHAGNDAMSYAGGGANDLFGGPSVANFAWHHVVAQTIEGVGTRLWVDSELVASANDNASLTSNGQAMMIGGNPDTGGDNFRTLFGAISEVAIWNRILSPGEIQTIWNNFDGSSGGATIAQLIEGLDSDGDGMTDLYEEANGLDKGVDDAEGDLDGDGLNNLLEFKNRTRADIEDSDGDGLNDFEEVTAGTDPHEEDTDGDNRTDFEELNEAPLTDPLDPDTDGDGRNDGSEVGAGTDPLDPNSFPLLPVLLHYSFDNDQGTEVINHGSLRSSGSLNGSATYVESHHPALGKAFMGNRTGANDAYVDTNHNGNQLGLGGQDYTASALIRWDGPAGQEDHMIFGQLVDGTQAQLHHGLRVNNGGVNDGHFGHWGNDVNDTGTVQVGVWHHIAFTYKSGRAAIHIDGLEAGSGNVGSLTGNGQNQNIVIGFTARNNNPSSVTHGSFNGAIDEVKIFERALDDTEIFDEANRSLSPPDPADPDPVLVITPGAFDANSETLALSISGIPANSTYHLRSSTDGQTFEVLNPAIDLTSETAFPLLVPVNAGGVDAILLQVFEGASN